MHPHHEAAIERVVAQLRADPEVKALLLAGSIAHGFQSADSDVDLLIVVSDAERGSEPARFAFQDALRLVPVPADRGSNNIRILVNAAAVTAIEATPPSRETSGGPARPRSPRGGHAARAPSLRCRRARASA